MAQNKPCIWQSLSEGQRQQVLAVLVQMLLRQLSSVQGRRDHDQPNNQNSK